jgi:hypothetical protein
LLRRIADQQGLTSGVHPGYRRLGDKSHSEKRPCRGSPALRTRYPAPVPNGPLPGGDDGGLMRMLRGI